MSVELKIKSKHLAVEAKIIRREEQKLSKQESYLAHRLNEEGSVEGRHQLARELYAAASKRNSLYLHRKNDVSQENRATFLARAYLAGRPYSYVERTRSGDYHAEWNFQNKVLPRVLTMVQKYGSKEQKKTTLEDVKAWSRVIPNS